MLERDIICSGLCDLATLRLEAGDNRAAADGTSTGHFRHFYWDVG